MLQENRAEGPFGQRVQREPPPQIYPAARITSRAVLARNSIFNLIGQGLPLLAAFYAIPRVIQGLGTDRFGILTLAWVVIGYFSLFDLGLGRALTQIVSANLSKSHGTTAPPLVWPAIALMFGLGLAGTLTMGAMAPWLVHSVLKIPARLQSETVYSFYILAGAIPIVVVTAGLVGILSAFQKFGIINALRAPMGIFTFAAPLAILPFSQSLVAVTAVLFIGRLLACGAYFVTCAHLMPPLRSGIAVRQSEIRPLFRFGIWMTVTNVIGPLMVYLDRFVIGASLSLAAVAYYATPYEVVTKLLIVPGAILGVLFPAFAASYRQDHDRMVRLFSRGTKYITLLLFPVILVIVGFAHEGLQWWLGSEFARHSTPVLQCLAVGVFINALAQVFATLVQGVGRPDLSAKLHMIELPIYLAILWWAIRNYGILGAAGAWTARVALDAALLFWLSIGFLGDNTGLIKRMAAGLLLTLGGLTLPLFFEGMLHRVIIAGLTVLVFTIAAWYVVLAEDERASMRSWTGCR